MALLCAALMVVTTTALATSTPERAGAQMVATATPLPGSMSQMVVDPVTQLVFVSLYDSGAVAVLDFSGRLVKTISGETAAAGLTLAGSHLYVVEGNGVGIDEIDTTTLTRTRALVRGLSGIGSVVAAAGALWVVQSNGASLTRVSLSDGSTTNYPNPLRLYGVGLAPDPSDVNTLIEFSDVSPASIARVDVSTDPPTLVVSQGLFSPDVENVSQIAVSPDGTHLIPAGGYPYQFDEFNMSDLQPTGVVYPANPYPTAIAMTAANGGLLAGGMNGIYDNDVVVYRLGDPSQPVATHDFNSTSQTVTSGGLAFSPDGTQLFAVTGHDPGPGATDTFHVLKIYSPMMTVSASSASFQYQRVGTYGPGHTITITNTGNQVGTISDLSVEGAHPDDYFGDTDCFPSGRPRALAPGAACHVTMYFAPLRLGARDATLVVGGSVPGLPRSIALAGSGSEGYYLADSRGEVANFGDAVFHGSTANINLAAPMISLATTSNGDGYWLLARDGGIFSFGNAAFYGSTGAMRLNRPIVAMTPTRTGRGYWLVASDGGIFSFGDARFYGSTGALRLNKPIVGMVATPTGRGYWLVASDGGVFSFGDARFYGSTGNLHLVRPITSMITTPTGHGYSFVALDGGIFTFGDARFFGSASGAGQTVVSMAATPAGRGYWIASATGAVFDYGDAPFYGDAHAAGVSDVIGIAATAPSLPPDLLQDATSNRATIVEGNADGGARDLASLPAALAAPARTDLDRSR